MKTKEELSVLKKEYDSLNRKLSELTDAEMEQVTGGMKIVVIKSNSSGAEVNGSELFQEREGCLGYGWLDQGTP